MEIWRGRSLADGTPIRVVQASWIETSVTHYPDSSGIDLTTLPSSFDTPSSAFCATRYLYLRKYLAQQLSTAAVKLLCFDFISRHSLLGSTDRGLIRQGQATRVALAAPWYHHPVIFRFTHAREDFILARNQVRGPEPASDRRNVLYGLLMARVAVRSASLLCRLSFSLKTLFIFSYLSL